MKIKSKCTISPTQMRINTPKRYCYCPSPLADHLLCAVPPGGQLINRSSIAEITFPAIEPMVFGETTPLRTARAGSEPSLSASRPNGRLSRVDRGGVMILVGEGQGGARRRHLEYKS